MVRFVILCLVFLRMGQANAFYENLDSESELVSVTSEPVVTQTFLHGNSNHESFSTAKRLLQTKIYQPEGQTVYCDCRYFTKEGKLRVDPLGCGFKPLKPPGTERDERIEWEHVVPASHIGQHHEDLARIWDQGHERCVTGAGKPFKGRACLEKVSREFRFMQADLHNLYPAIGTVNGYRSDRQMAEIEGENYLFGTCDAEFASQKFEPRDGFRGDVARTYLYMEHAYPGYYLVPESIKDMMMRWTEADPVDEFECLRHEKIAREQGNENPFVSVACSQLQTSTPPALPVTSPDHQGLELK